MSFYYATDCSKESRSNIEKLKISGIENCEYMTCRRQENSASTSDIQQEEKCAKFHKKFRKAAPAKCNKCKNSFHKISCTDESQERIEHIVRKK